MWLRVGELTKPIDQRLAVQNLEELCCEFLLKEFIVFVFVYLRSKNCATLKAIKKNCHQLKPKSPMQAIIKTDSSSHKLKLLTIIVTNSSH